MPDHKYLDSPSRSTEPVGLCTIGIVEYEFLLVISAIIDDRIFLHSFWDLMSFMQNDVVFASP